MCSGLSYTFEQGCEQMDSATGVAVFRGDHLGRRDDQALGIMDAAASVQTYLAEENCLMTW
jgi:hypothetical protein